MKKLITILYFQIGVNVIGLPDIFSLYGYKTANKSTLTSRFF